MNAIKSTKGTKIPKPYTAYTIFWRLERIYILQEAGYVDVEIKASFDPSHHDPLEHPRPSKYADTILPPYWYSSAQRTETEKRRKHRKQEGSISKNELTALISKSWREIDPEVKHYVSKLARAEKMKYTELRKASASLELSSRSSSPPLPDILPASLMNPQPKQQSLLKSSMPAPPVPAPWTVSLVNPPKHKQPEEEMCPPRLNYYKNRPVSMDSGLLSDEEVASTQMENSLDGASTMGTVSDVDLSLFDSTSLADDDFQFNFHEDTNIYSMGWK